MRLALAPKATGAEQAVVGGARGKRCLDTIESYFIGSPNILTSGVQDLFHKPNGWNERKDKIEGV